MSEFVRNEPAQSRAADTVFELINSHPNGVTFSELMRHHQDRITDNSSVIWAILLLIDEGNVVSDEPWAGEDYRNKVKLRPRPDGQYLYEKPPQVKFVGKPRLGPPRPHLVGGTWFAE